MIEPSADSGADCVYHPKQTWPPQHSQDRRLPRSCQSGGGQASSTLERVQWSFKNVDKRFPPAARAAAVEMSRY